MRDKQLVMNCTFLEYCPPYGVSKYFMTTVGWLVNGLLVLGSSACTSSDSSAETARAVRTTATEQRASHSSVEKSPPAAVVPSSADTLEFATQPGFEADLAIVQHDTLMVVATSRNVLFPFGEAAHAVDLRRQYPQFAITSGTEQARDQTYAYTLLRHKQSAVKFYDSEEDGALVVAGHIVNSDIVLHNKLHTNMTLEQVLHAFFSHIDQPKLQHVRVVRVDSGVAEIKYFYRFENGRLTSIDLDSYSVMSKQL